MADPGSSRRILVTGGGSGIGAAIVSDFVRAGHRVTVVDLDVSKVPDSPAIAAVVADITDSDGRQIALGASADGSQVEVLVNCAGIGTVGWFTEATQESVRREISLNLEALMALTALAVPPMIDAGWGRVINIASDAGRVGASREVVYSATKGGVIAFTAALAREIGRHGVTVNCVSPGPTRTRLLDLYPERQLNAITRNIPMRRLGEPEDVAAAVSFFASEAAGYITGQCLSVDGGLVAP